MVTVRTLERRIREVEGFEVRIVWPDGANVRSDYSSAHSYRRRRASNNNWTIHKWIKNSFKKSNPHFEVEVLSGNENVVKPHNIKLKTVRETY